MEEQRTPGALREGVQAGILESLRRDVEQRGGRTARLLVAAGIAGVLGAVGVTLLVSTHPFDHHPPWHVAVFSAVWAGLLVVTFAVAFLELRTPSLPLARAASLGLIGLGIAGVCGVLSPDHHFLHWWTGTAVGGALVRVTGLPLSALCFGLCTALGVGFLATAVLLLTRGRSLPGPLLPAAILFVLLAPGVALQSFGTSPGVFGGWLAGTAAGAYVGVAAGTRLRGWAPPREAR